MKVCIFVLLCSFWLRNYNALGETCEDVPQDTQVYFNGIETFGGNDPGASCRLPFVYKNKCYHKCITFDSPTGSPWCPTTPNFSAAHKMTYCRNTSKVEIKPPKLEIKVKENQLQKKRNLSAKLKVVDQDTGKKVEGYDISWKVSVNGKEVRSSTGPTIDIAKIMNSESGKITIEASAVNKKEFTLKTSKTINVKVAPKKPAVKPEPALQTYGQIVQALPKIKIDVNQKRLKKGRQLSATIKVVDSVRLKEKKGYVFSWKVFVDGKKVKSSTGSVININKILKKAKGGTIKISVEAANKTNGNTLKAWRTLIIVAIRPSIWIIIWALLIGLIVGALVVGLCWIIAAGVCCSGGQRTKVNIDIDQETLKEKRKLSASLKVVDKTNGNEVEGYEFSWKVMVNGKEVESGTGATITVDNIVEASESGNIVVSATAEKDGKKLNGKEKVSLPAESAKAEE